MYRCIRGQLKDKVVILVTHQLHFLKHVDEIIVLHKGKVAEMGTYENLMSKSNGRLSMLLEERKAEPKEIRPKDKLEAPSTAPKMQRRGSILVEEFSSILSDESNEGTFSEERDSNWINKR